MSSRDSPSLADAYSRGTERDEVNFIRVVALVAVTASIATSLILVSVLAVMGGGLGGDGTAPVRPVVSDSPVVADGNTTNASDSVYNHTLNSVVSIYAMNDNGTSSQGSGFVYTSTGHIVTNQHVVSQDDTFYVQYRDGEWTKAKVVGTDAYTDLAVLDPDTRPTYAEPLSVNEQLPAEGERVFAIGTPQDLRGSITSGIVSGTERSMATNSGFSIPDLIQTDSALNHGNSGGPLVNAQGEVVGVNRARQGDNIGFAISARMMTTVADDLIANGSHSHPLVGIRTVELTPWIAEANDLQTTHGILVTTVVADSPAEGDLRGNDGNTTGQNGREVPLGGDVIVALDGKDITDNQALSSYLMREKAPGDEVTATVIRDGNRTNVTFELGERPPFKPEQYGG